MIRPSPKAWAASLAAGAALLATTFSAPPVRAQVTTCDEYKIEDIIASGLSCTLGDKEFSNFTGLGDLADGTLKFSTSGTDYSLLFNGFSVTNDIAITYDVNVLPPDQIESLDLLLAGTGTPPTDVMFEATSGLPTSNTSLVTQIVVPTGTTITSIEQTLVQTPGPLPILGAATAFGYSRRLRKRISRVSGV